MPKISIILPTFNGSQYIEKAVQSVLNQSFQDWELIILDDCSTEDIKGVLTQFLKQEKRIRYFRNSQNYKLAKTLNKGIRLSKGKYIARIDDDDQWIDNDKLLKQVNFLDKNPDCVLIGTGYKIVDKEGKNYPSFCPPNDDQKIREVILRYNPFGHSTIMLKKTVMQKLGGYNEKLAYAEDYDFWLRIGKEGKMANLKSESVLYLLNKKGMSAQNTKKREVQFRFRIMKKYGIYYPYRIKALLNLFNYIIRG